MIQILFAFLAGVLTIAAPCILPMLPILLGASVGQQSKQRPLYIVIGFILSFTLLSFILSWLVNIFISLDIVLAGHQIGPRDIAIAFLALFGLFMLFPGLFEKTANYFNGFVNRANQTSRAGGDGNLGGFLLGLLLGIIWAPCAGPILGSILTLIATQGNTARSTVLLIAYALGAGIPMLVIAYGSQWITNRIKSIAKYSVRLQQIFGILILGLAVAMYFQYDIKIELALTSVFPQSSLENSLVVNGNPVSGKNPEIINSSTLPQIVVGGQTTNQLKMKIDFQNYGQAPDFTGIYKWLNSDPLTIAQLKGKVVLVDFWTYSCINCIRTLPYVTKWYDTYKDKGFVVIGVHTPEFAFEKVSDNVQTAIQGFGIRYPVAQDNDYGTWNAYNNQYWPAEYLINKDGEIVHEHFGEGEYDVTENAIRELLGLNDDMSAKTSGLGNIQSPEMYFEPSRLEYLDPSQQASTQPTNYQLPASLALNTFALGGTWQFAEDHAELTKAGGKIQLHFSSGKVYMVAASAKPVTLKITVDGIAQPDVTVQMSRLYTLFDSGQYKDHTIEIDIPDAGFQAFTFTFG